VQSILPAGTAGHGLPSGQIWALNFEPLWATLEASETFAVMVRNAIDIAPTSKVFVEQILRADIVSPRLNTDEIVPSLLHLHALLILLFKQHLVSDQFAQQQSRYCGITV
jgi:hypothetical protein